MTNMQMQAHLDKWAKLAKSTDRINKDRVWEDVTLLYRDSDRRPPKEIIFLDSPKDLPLIIAARPISNTWIQIANKARSKFKGIGIRAMVLQTAWGSVGSQVDLQLEKITSWRHPLPFRAQTCLPAIFSYYGYSGLNGLIAMAENAGFYVPYKDKIFISEKPSELIWKNDKCVHIEFEDGFTVSQLSPLERLARA